MKKTHLCLAVCAALLAACATAWEPNTPTVLNPPAGEVPAFPLQAEGVQIYACRAKADGSGYQWAFVAPEATLKQDGRVVGTHGAGPSWKSNSDRSSVKGAVRQRLDSGSENIPWLLLAATPADEPGMFAGVTSVQRVATKGGIEPAEKCDASIAGKEARVPYTADYYFWKRKP